MTRYRKLRSSLLLFPALFALAVLGGCNAGAAVSGNFDRSFNVTGPIRLELTNASGDVNITGSSDAKVHVHGEVHASGFGVERSESSDESAEDAVLWVGHCRRGTQICAPRCREESRACGSAPASRTAL